MEDSKSEPIKYVGEEQTDPNFTHGALRHAVGVHRYQALRSNREHPPEIGSRTGWTYNHQPYLCYWNDKFYFQYLSNQFTEHLPPGRTMLMTSKDGKYWSNPEIIFPEYTLPEVNYTDPESKELYHLPSGTKAIYHHRMGFYVTSDDRLLTFSFLTLPQSIRANPNRGQGLGRLVREVFKDGTYGPIYFIRYNRTTGWNETNTDFPYYKTSPDKNFIKACEEVLANKLVTLQWWEEERSEEGRYNIKPGDWNPEAFNYFRRPDGVIVGLWKKHKNALSIDEGKSWTDFALSNTFKTCGAKMWGQNTDDGRIAIVYNHSLTGSNRFPMVVMTSDDGYEFDNMLCLSGEVPPMRHYGWAKNNGPQYIRGIFEGNGNPPGGHLWNVFSVNKEDMWITRTRLPITGVVKEHVNQDFENAVSESDLEFWNIYSPKWAPVDVVKIPGENNKVLQLLDEEPYDYACAERHFPPSGKGTIEFSIFVKEMGKDMLEFELHNENDERALRLRFDPRLEGLNMDVGRVEPRPVPFDQNKWYDVKISFDCEKSKYDIWLNNKLVHEGIKFNMSTATLERMVFRTGSWRSDVRQYFLGGEAAGPGLDTEDLAGADNKVAQSIIWVDNVKTSGE